MTNEQIPTVIFQDGAGHYYVITPEMLGAARVSEEHAAKIQSLLAESDTTGFGWYDDILVIGKVSDIPGSQIGGLRLVGALPTLTPEQAHGSNNGLT